MEEELLQRLTKVENQLSLKKKDAWEKLQVLIPLLIPLSIALVGWYFTNQHNKNELLLQEHNSDNQIQVALINSNVGQSELIKDFMQHLTSPDTAVRNIAIEAILYAAPTPGKRIVEIMARTSDHSTRVQAIDALDSKRIDLVTNLFSALKQNRVIAATEISSNWTSDNELVKEILARAETCLANKDSSPDCDNGVYNSIVVLSNFPKSLIGIYKQEIKALIDKIPGSSQLTLNQAEELLKKIEL